MTPHEMGKLIGSLAGEKSHLKVELIALREQLLCQEVTIIALLAELAKERTTRIYQVQDRQN